MENLGEHSNRTHGQFLRDVMSSRNMSITEISAWSGIHQSAVERILLDQIPMTSEIAFRLSMATGISEKVWCTYIHRK